MEETVNRVSHEASTLSESSHPVSASERATGVKRSGRFFGGTGRTGSRPVRRDRRKAPPGPPRKRVTPLERQKATFVSTRSRLSDEPARQPGTVRATRLGRAQVAAFFGCERFTDPFPYALFPFNRG